MRWPWKRPDIDDRTLDEAKESLAKARADEPRVARIVDAHRRKIEQNHFGPTVHNALSLPRRENP